MADVLLCRDCRHFDGQSCRADANMRADYVNGGMATRNSADWLRLDKNLCGPTGAWFEPKEAA